MAQFQEPYKALAQSCCLDLSEGGQELGPIGLGCAPSSSCDTIAGGLGFEP